MNRAISHSFRVFLAAAKRDLRITTRYADFVVGMLMWPILMPSLTVFAAKALAGPDGSGLSAFAERAGTADYVGFVFAGMVMWMWLNMALWSVGGELRAEQRRGTLESNWMTPAPRLAMLLGSGFNQMIVSVIPVFVSLAICSMAWGVRFAVTPLVGLVFLMSTIAMFGLALAFASLVLFLKELNAAVFFVRGVFMVFCGLTSPLSVLPPWMRSVSRALPLTYSIDLVRRLGLAGASYTDVARDFWILTAFAAGLMAAGCLAFLIVDRIVKRRGTLGQY
jgi:ABC-2 type transport system permease protein